MTVPTASSAAGARRRPGLVVAVVSAFAVTMVWRFLAFTGFTNDHYGSLALAQQMLLGDRPIRDFSDPGWPGTYLVSAAAWLLFGNAVGTEWALTAVAFALAASFTMVAAYWLAGSLPVAVLVTAFEILSYPRTYSYPKLLPYAAAGCAMAALATRPSLRRILLMAAIVASAFLLRHDHGLFIGIASAACLALASVAEGWRAAARRVTLLTAAVAIILLPWIGYVTLNGGLASYFAAAADFSRAEANASNLRSWPTLRRAPGKPIVGLARPDRPLAQVEWRPGTTDAIRQDLERRYGLEFVRESGAARFYYPHDTTAGTIRALADDPQVAGTTGLGRLERPAWREWMARASPSRLAPALHGAANADAWLFWLFWGFPVLCAAMAVRRHVRGQSRWPGEHAAVGGLVVMALLVDAGFLRDILRTRFPDAIVPIALLGAWALGLGWRGRWSRLWARGFVRIAAVAVLGVTLAAIGIASEVDERIALTGIGDGMDGVRARAARVSELLASPHRQDLAPPSRYSAALIPFYEYLDRCSSPADRLIVTGEFPDVVVLAGRRFAGDGVVFGGGYSSAARQDRTIERLRQRGALFVLHMDAYSTFQRRFATVDAYLNREYEPMADVPVEGAGSVRILVQRSRMPARTDAATGWRCFQ